MIVFRFLTLTFYRRHQAEYGCHFILIWYQCSSPSPYFLVFDFWILFIYFLFFFGSLRFWVLGFICYLKKELLIKYLYDEYYDDSLCWPVKLFSITHTWWRLKWQNDVILTTLFSLPLFIEDTFRRFTRK